MQEEGAASGCGDDEDDVQRRIWQRDATMTSAKVN
jgi:hypothetical protein